MRKTAWKYTEYKANSHHFGHQNCLTKQIYSRMQPLRIESSHVDQLPTKENPLGGLVEPRSGQKKRRSTTQSRNVR